MRYDRHMERPGSEAEQGSPSSPEPGGPAETVAGRRSDGSRHHPDDPGVEVAASIRSLGQAARVFLHLGSPKVLVAGFSLIAAARLGAGAGGWVPLGPLDLVAVTVVVALVPFVEWFVHRAILHLEPRRVRDRLLDPGVSHRHHHDNPASVNWVVLTGLHALLFQVVNAGVAAAVVGLPMGLAGRPIAGPALTAVVAAMAALAHYEWSHFLFHTAYRPRTARYRRLKANHLRHHWRDERAWLGITSNLADRVLGTLPS